MRIGYFAMPLHPPDSDFSRTVHDDLEQIVTLDKLGYREVWVGEHFTIEWENIPSPELFLASAIPMTENIVLGTGVTCMPSHNPFHLAHRIAQLDHQAKGRFQWGVGSGASPLDFEVFGIDAEAGEHRSLTRETIDMVLKIWEGLPPGVYENGFWRFKIPEMQEDVGFRVHFKPYQKPHPPIAVAGLSARSETLALAGERGWIPMSINHVPASILRSHWDSVEQGAKITGRTPSRSSWRIARDIIVAETTDEARKEALDGVLARDFNGYVYPVIEKAKQLNIFKPNPDMPDNEVTLEYVVDNIWLVGSPKDVATKIRKLYADVGGFGMLLAMAHEWKPRETWVRSMTLLATEVMPSLVDLD